MIFDSLVRPGCVEEVTYFSLLHAALSAVCESNYVIVNDKDNLKCDFHDIITG